MKVIFMGTSSFAVPSLHALAKNHQVLAVVTQPDRAAGRGKSLAITPVKEAALALSLPILQPEKVKDEAVLAQLAQYGAEVFVVAAFGQILPKAILDMPRHGCINVHGSLLPKYRGAAPIQQALLDGEHYTGVTIMHMDTGIDTGDMILKTKIQIDPEDNFTSLHEKLAKLGAEDLIKALQLIQSGEAVRIHQDKAEATYAHMIKKEDGLIDWSTRNADIMNLIRGLDPWPTAYTYYEGQMLKIWKVSPLSPAECEPYKNFQNGEIVAISKQEGFTVKTGDGALLILEVQGVGKKRMSASDYMRGHEIKLGGKLCPCLESI